MDERSSGGMPAFEALQLVQALREVIDGLSAEFRAGRTIDTDADDGSGRRGYQKRPEST